MRRSKSGERSGEEREGDETDGDATLLSCDLQDGLREMERDGDRERESERETETETERGKGDGDRVMRDGGGEGWGGCGEKRP
jgi:hypothetical protein